MQGTCSRTLRGALVAIPALALSAGAGAAPKTPAKPAPPSPALPNVVNGTVLDVNGRLATGYWLPAAAFFRYWNAERELVAHRAHARGALCDLLGFGRLLACVDVTLQGHPGATCLDVNLGPFQVLPGRQGNLDLRRECRVFRGMLHVRAEAPYPLVNIRPLAPRAPAERRQAQRYSSDHQYLHHLASSRPHRSYPPTYPHQTGALKRLD